MTTFFFSPSSTSRVFEGGGSEPLSSPITLAPRREGMICAFQKRKFSLVSLSEGGLPRAAARDVVVEEDAMEMLQSFGDRRVVSLMLRPTGIGLFVVLDSSVGWCFNLEDWLMLRSARLIFLARRWKSLALIPSMTH